MIARARNSRVADEIEVPTDDELDASAPSLSHADRRDAFLDSHRARAILDRELERLTSEVSRCVASVIGTTPEITPNVQRVPGRCTVQVGTVALSLSWVRTRPDSVATGRLLVIEWDGELGRAAPVGRPRAVPRRELVLRADATGAEDWQWLSDDAREVAYDSRALAARCVDSLAAAARTRAS